MHCEGALRLINGRLLRKACILMFGWTLVVLNVREGGCLPSDRSENRIKIVTGGRRDHGRLKEIIVEGSSERKELDFYHRDRRFSDMIPIRDRVQNAVCAYEVIADINYQRIPNRIDRVICKAEDCKVIDDSDYRCSQMYATLNVTYPKENCRMEFEVMSVEYACICAKSIGSSRITIIEPVFT